MSLHIACLGSQFSAQQSHELQWYQELKRIICSNSVVCQNTKCQRDTSDLKTDKNDIETVSPKESVKSRFSPRKPRSKSGDAAISSVKKSNSQTDKTPNLKTKLYGDPKTAQDMVKAYIEADKLQQEQRVFR